MQDLGEQMSERTKFLAGQIDRLGDAVLRTVERGLNVISAAIAFMFVAVLMGYVLGLVHGHNRHDAAHLHKGVDSEKEELFLGRGHLLAGQQPGVQAVPLIKDQGGR